MDKLVINSISRYVALSSEEQMDISSFWSHFQLKKGQFLCKSGHYEDYFYIVEEGVQRLFFEKDGEEICLGFSYSGSWSGCYDSFVSRQPSRFSVEALSNSSFFRIHYNVLQKIYSRHPIMEKFGLLILEELLVARSIREIEMMSLSAEERFRTFMQRSPHLFQLVAQKHLASYLRMTPETFSRLRSLY